MKLNTPLKTIGIGMLATVALIFATTSSHAQTAGLNLPGTSGTSIAQPNAYAANSTPGGTGLIGLEFTVNTAIDLTSLGFYAQSIGGGDTPHVALLNITAGQTNPPVVIYDTGNLNNATVNPAGLTPYTMNYVSVGTPILLSPGQTYEVSTPIYFSLQYSSTSSLSFGSAIATGSYLQDGGWAGSWDPYNGSSVPPGTGQVYDYTSQTAHTSNVDVGGDFLYTVVPEPSTYALVGFGGLGMWAFLRRKKARIVS